MPQIYDCVVIGKGPAGISAAIYLKRAGFNAPVIGRDGGSLEKAGLIENYYGIAKPVKGAKLYAAGIKQAQNLGINIIPEEVTGIEYGGEGIYAVKSVSLSWQAKTVLIAAGSKRKTPPLKGIEEFAGKGVSWCAVCDGFFYKNKSVAVIGNGKYALSEALYLKNIAGEVRIFTNGEAEDFEAVPDIPVINAKIIFVNGNGKVEGILTEEGNYNTGGVFIASGSAGAADFALTLGVETENGNIKVQSDFSTNLRGVYAAGDCTGGLRQVAKAVSDGANAANSIIKYLRILKAEEKA